MNKRVLFQMKQFLQRLTYCKVKFDVCGMVTVDKTLLSSVNIIIYVYITFLIYKIFFFLGCDQCYIVLGNRFTVQLQLKQSPTEQKTMNCEKHKY